MKASLLARLALLSLVVMLAVAYALAPAKDALVAAGIMLGCISVAFIVVAAAGLLDE